MGVYSRPPMNPPTMGGGKRKSDEEGCLCAAIQITPRLLRPIVRRLLEPRVVDVTEQHLHPQVRRVIDLLLDLQDATSEVRARNGIRVQVDLVNPRRDNDDFGVKLRIHCDGVLVFEGELVIHRAWTRGKVSFAHAVVGSVEMLYFHLLEATARNEATIDMRLGVIQLTGEVFEPDTINGMTMADVAAAMAADDIGGLPGGGGPCVEGAFDIYAIYGAFPTTGYQYYAGTGERLVERPLPPP